MKRAAIVAACLGGATPASAARYPACAADATAARFAVFAPDGPEAVKLPTVPACRDACVAARFEHLGVVVYRAGAACRRASSPAGGDRTLPTSGLLGAVPLEARWPYLLFFAPWRLLEAYYSAIDPEDRSCGQRITAAAADAAIVFADAREDAETAAVSVIDDFVSGDAPCAHPTKCLTWRGVLFPPSSAVAVGRAEKADSRHGHWVACSAAAPRVDAGSPPSPAPGATVTGVCFPEPKDEFALLSALEAVVAHPGSSKVVALPFQFHAGEAEFWQAVLGHQASTMTLVTGSRALVSDATVLVGVAPNEAATVLASRITFRDSATESWAVGEAAGALARLVANCPCVSGSALSPLLTLGDDFVPSLLPWLNLPRALDALADHCPCPVVP